MYHTQRLGPWKCRLSLRSKPSWLFLCPEGHSFLTAVVEQNNPQMSFLHAKCIPARIKKKTKNKQTKTTKTTKNHPKKHQRSSQHVYFPGSLKITESKKGYTLHHVMTHVWQWLQKLFSAEIYIKRKSTIFLSAAKQAFKFCFMLALNMLYWYYWNK